METILINEELFRENSPIKDDTIVTKLVPYMLYYIFNLHQTTTSTSANISGERCIISLIYIKPQLFKLNVFRRKCCIISLIYIKPQHGCVLYQR